MGYISSHVIITTSEVDSFYELNFVPNSYVEALTPNTSESVVLGEEVVKERIKLKWAYLGGGLIP